MTHLWYASLPVPVPLWCAHVPVPANVFASSPGSERQRKWTKPKPVASQLLKRQINCCYVIATVDLVDEQSQMQRSPSKSNFQITFTAINIFMLQTFLRNEAIDDKGKF